MYVAKPKTYLEELNRLPPFVCWMVARRGRHPITQKEISRQTGWSLWKVEKFCGLTSWSGVTISDADLFRSACGIDRKNEYLHQKYLRRAMDRHRTAYGLVAARRRPASARQRFVRLSKTTQPASPAPPPAPAPSPAAPALSQ